MEFILDCIKSVILISIIISPPVIWGYYYGHNKISGGHGRFGYEPTNPIPANGIRGGHMYLSSLRCPDGNPFVFHRGGSVGAAPDGHIVDRYELLCADDRHRITLYVDEYHDKNSDKSPQSLEIHEPQGIGISSRLLDFESLNYEQLFQPLSHPEGYLDHNWTAIKQKAEADIKMYTEAIELKPNEAFSYSQRAQRYLRLKEYDRALADLEATIAKAQPEEDALVRITREQIERILKEKSKVEDSEK